MGTKTGFSLHHPKEWLISQIVARKLMLLACLVHEDASSALSILSEDDRRLA